MANQGLTRSLSHYLGRGATSRYPEGELELRSVPDWQSYDVESNESLQRTVSEVVALKTGRSRREAREVQYTTESSIALC